MYLGFPKTFDKIFLNIFMNEMEKYELNNMTR